MQSGTPSPLAGEGAARSAAGEGAPNRRAETTVRARKAAKVLRRRQTYHEQRLWGLLRDRRFSSFKFRRQVPIGPFVADFVCFEQRLILELDGAQHAGSAADERRDRWFHDDDFRVLRIWNGDLDRQREAVMNTIWLALHPSSVSASPSHLLPQGEKGRTEPKLHGTLQSGTPSPLAGEGAARSAAGEGA